MWCCRVWPGLSLFCCYQPSCVISKQSWFGLFCFINFPIFTPCPSRGKWLFVRFLISTHHTSLTISPPDCLPSPVAIPRVQWLGEHTYRYIYPILIYSDMNKSWPIFLGKSWNNLFRSLYVIRVMVWTASARYNLFFYYYLWCPDTDIELNLLSILYTLTIPVHFHPFNNIQLQIVQHKGTKRVYFFPVTFLVSVGQIITLILTCFIYHLYLIWYVPWPY